VRLAASLAERGYDVILVDASIARPDAEHITGIDSAIGLSDILMLGCSPIDHLVPSHGFRILPGGHSPEMTQNLYASKRAGHLFTQLSSDADFVLISSPPAASPHAEAISATANGTILSLSEKQTPITEIRKTVSHLKRLDSDVVALLSEVTDEACEAKPKSFIPDYFRPFRTSKIAPKLRAVDDP
jgi:Mrp family chromosome partitioning ATPase